MSWREYFTPTAKCPARLKLNNGAVIDFGSEKTNDDILSNMYAIWESNSPYLEITDAGKEKFLGIKKPSETSKKARKKKEETITPTNKEAAE